MADAAAPGTRVYCPYADADVPIEDTTREHIIPLALGGSDALTIPASGGANSRLGSQIDGGMAKEFVVSRARVQQDARGHAGREPVFRIKNARDQKTGKPLSLTFGKRLEIYDPIERRRRSGVTVQMQFTIDIDIRLRFLAKCFLSAGYLVYGDFFRRAVRHADLRLIMKRRQDLSAAENASVGTRYYGWLERDLLDERQLADCDSQRDICSMVPGSMLVFMAGRANLGLYGSVLGEYLGFLNVQADMTDFPWSAEDQQRGHVITVQDGTVFRCSYLQLATQLMQELEKPRGEPGSSG